jgi:peptide/nickel transport system permease protein
MTIIYGLRTSLMVAGIATLCALLIGMALGTIAAYFGGRIDTLIMRLVDLQLSVARAIAREATLSFLGVGGRGGRGEGLHAPRDAR